MVKSLWIKKKSGPDTNVGKTFVVRKFYPWTLENIMYENINHYYTKLETKINYCIQMIVLSKVWYKYLKKINRKL